MLIEITQITWVIIGITSILFEFVRQGGISKISTKEYKYPFSLLRSTFWTKVIFSVLVTVLWILVYYIVPSTVSIPEQVKSDSLKELLSLVKSFSFMKDIWVNHLLASSNIPLVIIGLILLFLKYFPSVYLIFSVFDVAINLALI